MNQQYLRRALVLSIVILVAIGGLAGSATATEHDCGADGCLEDPTTQPPEVDRPDNAVTNPDTMLPERTTTILDTIRRHVVIDKDTTMDGRTLGDDVRTLASAGGKIPGGF